MDKCSDFDCPINGCECWDGSIIVIKDLTSDYCLRCCIRELIEQLDEVQEIQCAGEIESAENETLEIGTPNGQCAICGIEGEIFTLKDGRTVCLDHLIENATAMHAIA